MTGVAAGVWVRAGEGVGEGVGAVVGAGAGAWIRVRGSWVKFRGAFGRIVIGMLVAVEGARAGPAAPAWTGTSAEGRSPA